MVRPGRFTVFLFALLISGALANNPRKVNRNKKVGSRSDYESTPPQVTKNDDFDWKLVQTAFLESRDNALLCSFSAKLLLHMIYEGTGSNSQTQQELNGPLQRSSGEPVSNINLINLPANDARKLVVANRIFADRSIQVTQKYAATVNSYYNASVQPVDFQQAQQAAQEINQWVAAGSQGQIQQLVTPDTVRDTIVMLANTVYFKGLWKEVFPNSATINQPFMKADGRSVVVPFMKQHSDHYYTVSKRLKAEALRLPYADGQFAMVLLLPFENSNLNEMLSALSADAIHEILTTMDEVEVQVELPRFRIEYKTSLKPVLQQLGINRIFQDDAELGGIARGGPTSVKVSDLFQKSVIEVDEKGSTASAASGSTLVFTIATEPENFVANRPFLFFIEEESTGTVLFVGKVEEPLS